MRTIAQILAAKPDQTLCTTVPEAAVFDAAALMVYANVGALVVMEAGELLELVTECHLLHHGPHDRAGLPSASGQRHHDHPRGVRNARTPASNASRMMTSTRQRRLTVQGPQKVRGTVPICDLVKDIFDRRIFTIRHLALYING